MDTNDPWNSNGIISENTKEKTTLCFDDSFDPPEDIKKEGMFFLCFI